MNTTFHRDSARIYTFPKRMQGKVDKYSGLSNSVVSPAFRRVTNVAFGSGWYHEAAIEEAERDRTNRK